MTWLRRWSKMERRREYLVQMQPIGRKSDMSRADSFFGMLPAIAPAHSCSPTDGVSPLRYALIALQYSSSNSVGPYLQNSRGLPSSPGDLLFGCLRAHRSSVSKPPGRLISGRDPAGIRRIASLTWSEIGHCGIGAIAGSSQTD